MWNETIFQRKTFTCFDCKSFVCMQTFFWQSKAENQSRQFMETSNRSFIYLRSRTGGSRRCWHFSLLWILWIYLDHKAMFNFTIINDFLSGFGSTLMQVRQIMNYTGVQKDCTLNHIQVDSSGWVQTTAKQSQIWRQTQVRTKRSNLKAPLKRHPPELKQLANKSTTLLVTADLVVFILEGNFPLYNLTALHFHY